MISRDAKSVVDGEVFFLKPATYEVTLGGCDQLEEIPNGCLIGQEYRRIAVRVQSESGEVVAWAYARPDSETDADLQPLIEMEKQRLRRT